MPLDFASIKEISPAAPGWQGNRLCRTVPADMILSARAVDGVYDADPKVHKDAKKYDTIPIKEVVDKQLGVMDLAAAVLCMENRMPMTIFGLNEENSIINTVKGKSSGTVITV